MVGKNILCIEDDGATDNEIGNILIEQSCAMTVTTIATSTGKLVIHAGTFNVQN
jgi:hypothetical protein